MQIAAALADLTFFGACGALLGGWWDRRRARRQRPRPQPPMTCAECCALVTFDNYIRHQQWHHRQLPRTMFGRPVVRASDHPTRPDPAP